MLLGPYAVASSAAPAPAESDDATSGATASAAPAPGSGAGLAAQTRTVTYRGLRLDVPATWAVHDLEAEPETCVRFDQSAVYLGTPGTEQRCPAHAVGRAPGLLVAPADPDTVASPAPLGSPVLEAPDGSTGGTPDAEGAIDASLETTYALTGTGLAVTVVYGEREGDVAAVGTVLGNASYSGPTRETPYATAPTPTLEPALSDPATFPAGGSTSRYLGRGFDTCSAPSTATLRAWLASSYRSVGIYIGGVNRACPDGNLSRAWVEANAKAGWRMLPIYVGRQAPCAFQDDLGPIRPTNVAQQGTDAARDAIIRAQGFGLEEGTAIYYDMESYNTNDAGCRTIVLDFLSAWTKRLHDSGYLSGVYSSATSGIRDLSNAYTSGTFVRPDAIWIARWNGVASVWGEPEAPDSQWGTHQRLKQYRGPHTETWGGRSIEIDSDVIDGPLSTVRFVHQATAATGLVARAAPTTASASVRVYPAGATLPIVCQIWAQRVGTTRIWDKLTDGTYVSDLHVNTASNQTWSPPIPKCRLPFTVNTDRLETREGPSLAYPAVGTILRGGLAYISCQRSGQLVANSSVWDKLDTGVWIPDGFTNTPGRPGFSSPIPRC